MCMRVRACVCVLREGLHVDDLSTGETERDPRHLDGKAGPLLTVDPSAAPSEEK